MTAGCKPIYNNLVDRSHIQTRTRHHKLYLISHSQHPMATEALSDSYTIHHSNTGRIYNRSTAPVQAAASMKIEPKCRRKNLPYSNQVRDFTTGLVMFCHQTFKPSYFQPSPPPPPHDIALSTGNTSSNVADLITQGDDSHQGAEGTISNAPCVASITPSHKIGIRDTGKEVAIRTIRGRYWQESRHTERKLTYSLEDGS